MEEKALTPQRVRYLTKDYSRGFIGDVGFKAIRFGRGYLESRLRIFDRHRQQDHYIHAGVIATMADHTAGYAAFTLVPEDHRILTIEFKINFLWPAYGKALVCRSKIVKEGRQILVGESEVFDQREEGEELVAKAMVTLRSIHQSRIKPVGPTSSKKKEGRAS
ncbi:MAG: PaaI family thioesterase [Desulfobacterota bacterium]|nr:PaaI family thioesterase [Thermodesulfobacteriota bacterium]